MKYIFLTAISFLLTVSAFSQSRYYTRYYADTQLKKTAKAWSDSGAWRNGFTKASPDESVNLTEFYEQYQRNPELWKALFEWLEHTDLNAIPKGKQPIPGTPLVASVEDSQNEPIEKRRTESHYHVIDFMFVVSGTEGFRVLDHYTSKANTEYKPDVIRYDYNPQLAKTIESLPDRFLIFFPSDWHIAKVATVKEDQNIRVIVVKMPYVADYEWPSEAK